MFWRPKKYEHSIKLNTLIGQDTRIEGGITFSGGLRVEGYVKGNIVAEEENSLLTVSESGIIEGQVKVPYIILSGSVTGDVHATKRLELANQAQVHGDVYYHLIEMAVGAKVNGNFITIEDKPVPKLALTNKLGVETTSFK
ncbi:integral membrane protein ccma [Candidatus Nitrosoglobus terrae]|uniref:Integral membrane protein ccma n=1 Tax=Candidatus Nitrosoglobus terrae TaxID=1630141 RepID=A0A1Q2SK47_9GAMM|nr:polymer-forming cytoskeletal protein [Candidatus Nitrosoglobus terrae]BAW79494.1 integral membrane protein ccma [Candidatus Nitrosoglobus terrae]